MPTKIPMMAVLCFAITGTGSRSTASDEQVIRAAREAQNTAIAALNLDSIASFWCQDVQVTTGLGLAFRGRDVYRRAFLLDSAITYQRVPETIVVNSRWPIASESGTWSGRWRGRPGPPVLSGRYSAQWVKVDGRWLIRAELFVALDCSGQGCQWPARPE
jgi:ketosteroid isomerase-like protein